MNRHDPPTQNEVREELWRKYQQCVRIMSEARIVMVATRMPALLHCVMTNLGMAHYVIGQWWSLPLSSAQPISVEWWIDRPTPEGYDPR